jgi:levansucrase
MSGVQSEIVLDAEEARNAVAGPPPSIWSAAQVAQIDAESRPEAALIGPSEATSIAPDLTLWDLWPIQTDEGALAQVAGGTLWVILSAIRSDDPDARHEVARMRLFHLVNGNWRDCGNLLPDGFSPGRREWSGSTRLDPATGALTLWFTAAGRREGGPRFEQRLFRAVGKLDLSSELPSVSGWSNLSEALPNDGSVYADTGSALSVPGLIKGFRDPYWFRDPKTGIGYLLFTASKSASTSTSTHDGVVGIAQACDADGLAHFIPLPAIIDATGLCNELELPHVLYRDGAYYLFWCSQKSVFAPGGPVGPTGLYGMVAPSLFGPYEPLNGTGLVLANPAAEPRQAYGWRVLPTLDVVSFVDYWGLEGRDIGQDPALKAAQFGGTIAPMTRIEITGKTTRIVAKGA